MRHFFSRSRGNVLWLPSTRGTSSMLSPVIALPFICGILLGCIFGLFSDSIPAYLSALPLFAESAAPASFSGTLWLTCRYLFFTLLLSASLFGVLFLPCLAFLRGFLLACAVAACFAARRYLGLADAALCFGIPALLEIPVFLMAAGGGLRFSLRLLSATGIEFRRALPDVLWRKRLLFLLPLLLLALLYRQTLLPTLMNQLL